MPTRLLRPVCPPNLRTAGALTALVIAGLAGAPGAVIAAPAAPCAPFSPQDVPQQSLATTIATLQRDLSYCQKNALWLAALGHLLNRQGRYPEATEHLERALMLEPDLQTAQLDYALALAGVGDTPSAMAVVQSLLATPDLPPDLQPVLQRQLAAWARTRSTRTGWQLAGAAGVRVGFDSNLLAAPDLATLTLTFPGQSQVLPLDASYRPQEGSYQQADLQLQLRRPAANAKAAVWDVAASLRRRSSSMAANAGTRQYDLLVERSSPQGESADHVQGSYYLNAALFGQDSQAGTRFEATGVAAGWGQTTPACQNRVGLELQDRRYTSNPLLSGSYAGLAAALACNPAMGRTQWQVGLKVGRDTARDIARAGGDQTQANLRLVARLPLASGWRGAAPALAGSLLADAELSTSQDSAPYSPLLENGRVRTLRRNSLRVEWQLPLTKTPQWATHWMLGADWTRQQSNLELFEVQNRGFYTALRLFW